MRTEERKQAGKAGRVGRGHGETEQKKKTTGWNRYNALFCCFCSPLLLFFSKFVSLEKLSKKDTQQMKGKNGCVICLLTLGALFFSLVLIGSAGCHRL